MLSSKHIEDSNLLNKLCDDLINFRVTADDIIAQEESVVSSTESTPVKQPATKVKKAASQRIIGLAKALSSGRKSMEILNDISPNESPVGKNQKSLSSTPCTSKAGIDAAAHRARQIFSTPNEDDSEDEEVDLGVEDKLKDAMEEIKRLKRQLQKSIGIHSCQVI